MNYNDTSWNVAVSSIDTDRNGNPILCGKIRKGTGFVSKFRANLDAVEIFYGNVPKYIRSEISKMVRDLL
jgi:hypothetical protein